MHKEAMVFQSKQIAFFLLMGFCGLFLLSGCPENYSPPATSCVGLPNNGPYPLDVQFADMTDPGVYGLTYWHWDFGDGMTSNVQHPRHEYTKAGTFVATLTVGSPGGENSASAIITVTKPSTSVRAGGTITTIGGMDFVWIPAGSFAMGADSVNSDEYPTHTVTISQGFWMGRTEVTQGQWKQVMSGANPSYTKGDDLPVEQVSWADCQTFIARANLLLPTEEQYNGQLRLPTEAEWEYACRANVTGDYLYGSGESGLENFAWFSYTSKNTTHSVKKKFFNGWGLYDILGNVGEWCQDIYASDYYLYSPDTDPQGPLNGGFHVVRGGNFTAFAINCRCASRDYLYEDKASRTVGLRLVKEDFGLDTSSSSSTTSK